MMVRLSLLLALVGHQVAAQSSPPANMSPQARQLFDSALSVVKGRAYWRDTVTWTVVDPDVMKLAAGAQTTDDVYPAIRLLLARLGDHHSSIISPAVMRTITASGTTTGAARPQPEGRMLEGSIGYLTIPGHAGSMQLSRQFITTIHNALSATTPACGWVVDLRQNGGGNMWPMLAGLKPFLGSGPLGSFLGANGETSQPWLAGEGYDIEAPLQLQALESAYVAVLTGPRTASSGEAVAIAFHGRANTRSFGQPTRGLANANSSIPMPDGGMLNVMVSIDVDRTGKKYGHQVEPDELVTADTASGDAVLAAATLWLRTVARCPSSK